MTFAEFDQFQSDLLAEVVKMKNTKGKEYAHDTDRFANFRRLSKELKCPCCKANLPMSLIGYIYFKKHLDSIVSYLNERQEFSGEGINGRFVDLMTYAGLIAGMVEEEKGTIKTGCGLEEVDRAE